MTKEEMVGWHHRLNGHEFEQAQGVCDGQESLAYCSPWGCNESDTTERLNCTEQSWAAAFSQRLGSRCIILDDYIS